MTRRSLFSLLCVMLLVFAICPANVASMAENYRTWNLSDYEATIGSIKEFSEAPVLAEKVARGELPPVSERLPANPLVVKPVEQIGKYGGSVTGWGLNPESFGNNVWTARTQRGIAIYPDWQTIAPEVFESYELSEDQTVFTIHLRKGMRWSDGHPFTADDILFWWDDIVMNKELSPSVPAAWLVDGQPMEVERIDDYTVLFKFVGPNPRIISVLTNQVPWAPTHYLEEFHIKYNPDAKATAKEAGYDDWYQLFAYKNAGTDGMNPDMPSLDPWVLARVDLQGNKYYERNPYYYKVDIEGNQLPYIDTQVRLYVPTKEQVVLKIMAGEVNYGSDPLELSQVAVLREGEKQGRYETILMPGVFGSVRRYQFNYTVKDPVLREIFNDIRFRKAMSLAINRQEVNDTLFYGLGVPRQYTSPSVTTFFEDWMAEYYIDYDVAEANRLLDEMGLHWDEQEKARLRPDGKPLKIQLLDGTGSETDITEMVVGYWEDVGVNVEMKTVTRELLVQRAQANDIEASVWYGDVVDEFSLHSWSHMVMQPAWGLDAMPHSGGPWRKWELTGGKQGEEPPPAVKDLMSAAQAWLKSAKGTKEYNELGKEFLTKSVEGLWVIGIVGETPKPLIVSERLRNFPRDMTWVNHLNGSQGDQWFWEDQ